MNATSSFQLSSVTEGNAFGRPQSRYYSGSNTSANVQIQEDTTNEKN